MAPLELPPPLEPPVEPPEPAHWPSLVHTSPSAHESSGCPTLAQHTLCCGAQKPAPHFTVPLGHAPPSGAWTLESAALDGGALSPYLLQKV
jgi:hypothetical protein